MNNLAKRIAVSVIGVPLVLILVRYSTVTLSAVIVVLQLAGLWEWNRLSQLRESRVSFASTAIVVIALDGLVFSFGKPLWLALFIASTALLFLSETFRRARTPLTNLGSSILFIVYVGLPLALWVPMQRIAEAERFMPLGVVVLLLITTWVCDTAAYFIGSTFGKHKLYPAASPNKTVEGFAAGLIFSGIVPLVVVGLHGAQLHVLDYFVLPITVGIAGQLGDLLESLMKREVRIKDSAAILPGHGGILDRFDSLLISSPILFSYLLLT